MEDKRYDPRFQPVNCDCTVRLQKQVGYIEYWDQQVGLWKQLYPNYRVYIGDRKETVTLLAADGRSVTVENSCGVLIDGVTYTGLFEAYNAIQALVLEVQKEIANFREGGGVGNLAFEPPLFFESDALGKSFMTGHELDLNKDGMWYVESRAMAFEPAGVLAYSGTSSLVARTLGDGVTNPISSANTVVDPATQNFGGTPQNFLQPFIGVNKVEYRVQPGGPDLKWKLFIKFEFFGND